MQEANEAENVFQYELSKKVIINETFLLKKVQLIKKYYGEAKKALAFFNSQSFDRKSIQKQIFELFFSTRYYQGMQPFDIEGSKSIIQESSLKFIAKKTKIPTQNILNSDSNVFEMSKEDQKTQENPFQPHEYHYFGEVLNAQASQQPDNSILHGFGLLINFQTKLLAQDPSCGCEINCYFGQFINGLKHGEGMEFRQVPNSKSLIEVYLGKFANGTYDDEEAIWFTINLIEKLQKDQTQEEEKQSLSLEYIDKYFGGFVNGKKHGNGKISSVELFYDGEWRFDKPQGNGQIWTSTSYYRGKFKSGLKHRNGKQWFKNGDIYEGSYFNNKPNGFGNYIWKNGSFYEGQFKNGLRDGKGLWKSGPQSYEGNYLNDKKSGEGIYYWNDGETYYKGTFYEDLRHGYGQMYWDNRKSAYKGKWKQGFQDGYGQVFELQPHKNELKLVKKGQFVKGIIVQEIIQRNETSLEVSPERKSLTSESDGLQNNRFSQQKSEELSKEPKSIHKSLKKPIKLRKPSLIKGIKNQIQPDLEKSDSIEEFQNKQATQNFNKLEHVAEKKRFVKSQNQNYNQFLNKEEALQHIHAKHRYLMEVQKNPVQKEHLYGSVYLIKSGRKKMRSSVQNASRNGPNTSRNGPTQEIIRKSTSKLPIPVKQNPILLTKNHRSNSYSSTPPVKKLLQEQEKTQRLQKIQTRAQLQRQSHEKANKGQKNYENQMGPKEHLNLPRRNSSNQAKYNKLRYFDPEDEKEFAELEPLIVWNNFSKNTRRSFLK